MVAKQKHRKIDTVSQVTLQPVETEKTTFRPAGASTALYAFFVPNHATKVSVANLVSALFGVQPIKVNMTVVRGKTKRVGKTVGKRADRKKAYVLVPAGTSLDVSVLEKASAETEENKQ